MDDGQVEVYSDPGPLTAIGRTRSWRLAMCCLVVVYGVVIGEIPVSDILP